LIGAFLEQKRLKRKQPQPLVILFFNYGYCLGSWKSIGFVNCCFGTKLSILKNPNSRKGVVKKKRVNPLCFAGPQQSWLAASVGQNQTSHYLQGSRVD
jgi:hypothetical protein